MKNLNPEWFRLFAVIGLSSTILVSACKKESQQVSKTASTQVPSVMVSTIAGSLVGGIPVGGSLDGMGTAASFLYPDGIALDNNGNLFVTDNYYQVRQITSSLAVTTIAGSTQGGYLDGPGITARFLGASGIAADGNGNLFVVDSYNSVIRKISPAHVVSTFAGNQSAIGSISKDGTGTAATFKYIQGIAADLNGNLFVTDGYTIRKITPAGVVTTFAGNGIKGSANGKGTIASFNSMAGIAVDANGNVYVSDTGNDLIRKITPAGVVSTMAGNGTRGYLDGTGTSAGFSDPVGIAVDAKGNIYVADYHVIRRITPDGAVVTIAGDTTDKIAGGKDGPGKTATFFNASGIVVATNGDLYVADYGDNLIRKIVFQ